MTKPNRHLPAPVSAVDQLVRSWLDEDAREVEGALLALLLRDETLYLSMADVINVADIESPGVRVGDWVEDFQHTPFNHIFRAHRLQVEASNPVGSAFPAQQENLLRLLRAAAHGKIRGWILTPVEADLCAQELDAVLQRSNIELMGIERALLRQWSFVRRLTRHGAAFAASPGFGAARLVEAITKSFQVTVNRATDNDDEGFIEFGADLDNPQTDVARVPTPLPDLNRVLGGGFGRGEGTLIIGATGSGKSVLASQLSLAFAAAGGLRCLYITTEEKPARLEPRFVANYCDIDYGRIKDGFPDGFSQAKFLSAADKQRIRDMKEMLREKILWLRWGENRDRAVVSHLQALLEKAEQKLGGLDCVFLDWIGSAIGRSLGDTSLIRLALEETADYMAQIAEDTGIITVSFAQANQDRGVDNPRVDSSCIHASKSLGRNMTNILGISALRTAEANVKAADFSSEGVQKIFRERQLFYVSKSRRGEASLVPIRRDFGYQRFLPHKVAQ